jgi:hypothetical protein
MSHEENILFWLAGQSISQHLRIQPSKYVVFPYAGWWKAAEGKERGESTHPSTPAQGRLSGILYLAGGEERGGE